MNLASGTGSPDADAFSAAQQLGGKLKAVREYLNLSQQYVSERTGIPRSAISDIERGVRRVDSLELKKLAGLFKLPAGYFLDDDNTGAPGDFAIAALARALTDLTDDDKQAVQDFAEFLRLKRGKPTGRDDG